MYRAFLFFISCLIFTTSALAQNTDTFTLRSIEITGNNWTKDQVVERELNFRIGDERTLQFFVDIRVESEERLKNLGIFNDVILSYNIDSLSKTVDCSIQLIENWYIFPGVILELADRNFSEWWTNQNRDFSRINYGVRLDHINLTGRRDRMVLQLQSGFRKKYELVYNQPYLNKQGTWGGEAFIFFANQDQIPYKTENNRTIYGGFEERSLLKRFRTGSAAFYRPTIYHHHAFRLEYHKNEVDDYVIEELNPDYFLNGRNSIQFFMFNYHYTYDRRIAQFYPISGYLFFADLKKEGFKIFDEFNNTSISLGAEYYYPLTEKLVFGTKVKVKANIDRSIVSFANNTGLGWRDDVLGGYYLYVVDGTDYVYSKNNIRYQLIDKKFNLGKYMFLKQFRVMNLQIYTRAFFDMGYVNDRTYKETYNNTFSNRLLYGFGPAADIVLYNNYMVSFNLGFNHLGERHYFFQYRTNF